jgi:predicted Zn-ribbon and HTH transcriptional regulator
MYDLYNLPLRDSEDGPDANDRTVFVTCCQACGWEDPQAHASQADCMVETCPECKSEHLLDEEFLQEYYQ